MWNAEAYPFWINPEVYLKNLYLPAETLAKLDADKIFEMHTQGVG